MKINLGDRIIVTKPGLSFGDYDTGDTGVVKEAQQGDGRFITSSVIVEWDQPRFTGCDSFREANRCTLLFEYEFELVTEE